MHMYICTHTCTSSSEPRGQRQGYMGHLMKMVNLIMHCGEADQNLALMLKDTLEEDVQKRWNDFLSSTVADTNKKNETNLVGVLTLHYCILITSPNCISFMCMHSCSYATTPLAVNKGLFTGQKFKKNECARIRYIYITLPNSCMYFTGW